MQINSHKTLYRPIQLQVAIALNTHIQMTQNKLYSKAQYIKYIYKKVFKGKVAKII